MINYIQMIDKRTKKYKSFINRIDDLFDLCEENNIIAKRNWTCCNTCGQHEMMELVTEYEADDPETKYIGFIFYHDQEAESIEEALEQYNDIIIHLNWGYCYKEDYDKDEDGIKLAEIISKIATDNGYMLEYVDFSKKLVLHMKLS